MNKEEQVWFISGCSTGFGKALATAVLEQGYKAIVTARNLVDVEDLLAQYPEHSKGLVLDLENHAQIVSAASDAIAAFGRIDVLVNNAGIGYFSSAEEADMQIVRKMFEVNFFGLTELTSLILPQMRKQKSGHVMNVSSIGGLVGFPAVSFYNATKFAVAGYSEALAKETAHLNIKVTVVCPSGFRTDWAGRSAFETPIQIEDYAPSAGANAEAIRSRSGKQPGDPVAAAHAMIKAYEATKAPLYLMLGAGALNGARKKLEDYAVDFDAWADTSLGADVPLPA
jgi:short-subunit dehydrogenase